MGDIEKSEIRARRTRALLRAIADSPRGSATWAEAWSRALQAVPFTAEEAPEDDPDGSRIENIFKWRLTDFDKAGWLLTGVGELRITEGGRDALTDYTDPVEFAQQLDAGYQEWNRLRSPQPEWTPPDLSTHVVAARPEFTVVEHAALRIFTEGMRAGGSAFAPGRHVWTREVIADLRKAFIDRPDLGDAKFLAKLAGQLQDASDDTILLTAELLALAVLPLASWKADTKRQRIKSVLALMEQPVAMSADINAAMEYGVFNGGLAFQTHIWRALRTMIEMADAWAHLDALQQDRAWSTPAGWAAFLETLPKDGTIKAARAEMRYLRFPEYFLPIVSIEHQERIRDAFLPEIGQSVGDLDADLRAITLALQAEAGGPVDFYADPYQRRWDGASSASGRRAWLVRGSSVKGVNITEQWRDEEFVSLAASQMPELEPPFEPTAIRDAVETGYSSLAYAKRSEKLRDIRAFLLGMSPGDIVVTTSEGALYAGVVQGEAQFNDSPGGRSNLRRAAQWVADAEPVRFDQLSAPLKAQLGSSGDLIELTELIADLEPLIEVLVPARAGDNGVHEPTGAGATSTAGSTLMLPPEADTQALLVSRAWIEDLVATLNDKRQAVLYGPPGTGKTYLAKAVAALVAPVENIRMVQFHPSYSYEDFFEGYRPIATDEHGRVGFALRPGPFRRIAEDARANPAQPYVLIIDEINRANLAKVFGELYYLLEYREEPIELQYSEGDGKMFTLPSNVYVIGTMNTADRSIALFDAAMRRRFGFLSLHPDDPALEGALERWLAREGRDDVPARLLQALNDRIPDEDLKIGHSYFMTPASATDAGLERIWRTAILPLLEELHYGDGTNVHAAYGLDAIRQAAGAVEAAD